jgi:hypothetical protein
MVVKFHPDHYKEVTSLLLPILASNRTLFSAVDSCLQQEQFRRGASPEFVLGMDAHRLDHCLDLGAERGFPTSGRRSSSCGVRWRQFLSAVRLRTGRQGALLLELRVRDLDRRR